MTLVAHRICCIRSNELHHGCSSHWYLQEDARRFHGGGLVKPEGGLVEPEGGPVESHGGPIGFRGDLVEPLGVVHVQSVVPRIDLVWHLPSHRTLSTEGVVGGQLCCSPGGEADIDGTVPRCGVHSPQPPQEETAVCTLQPYCKRTS